MESPRKRRPAWVRVRALDPGTREAMSNALSGLHTVCEEANCPNIGECYCRGTVTFMIMGNACTRDCKFCAVSQGKPTPLDPDEPRRLADSARQLGLKHVVITSVTRDDLPDGGAAHFASCIAEIRRLDPAPTIEVLTPDFQGDATALDVVLSAQPEVFNHNVETVPRLYPLVRSQADFARSLGVLARARNNADRHPNRKMLVKSGLMLGLGESFEEVVVALGDLKAAGVQLLTIGQYLKPRDGGAHCEIVRYAPPEEFEIYADVAREMGFLGVASAPLVRSSYHAEEQLGRL